MRCTYCRPATLENPRNETRLTPAEIESLARHLASSHNLRKVRLTGGDPTSRPELTEIITRLSSITAIRDVAITTNGLTLAHRAHEYANAGLRRVNISLDTLDPVRFAEMTGVDALPRVLRGIDTALDAGLDPIRLNTVVLKDANDTDLPDILRFAAHRGLEARFIELMPMGPLAPQWAGRFVPEARMRRILSTIVRDWSPIAQGHDAARRFRVTLDDGRQTTVGFITPMSCNFCAACNRIRIAADGTLYPCLMDKPVGSLLPALRPAFNPDLLDHLLARGLQSKRAEHPHEGAATMTQLGG